MTKPPPSPEECKRHDITEALADKVEAFLDDMTGDDDAAQIALATVIARRIDR